MDATLEALLKRGCVVLTDTKQRKAPAPEAGKPRKSRHTIAEAAAGQLETDPHKIFIRKAIDEKPSKADIVDEIKKFIKEAEKHA